MEHITINASQQGASYITEFVISEIETPTQSLNPSSSSLTAEYFLDAGFTNKIGEASPPNTIFSYDRNSAEDYIIYCKITGASDEAIDSLEVEVLDYKPVFNLVNYECKTVNILTSFNISSLELNELTICEGGLDPLVQWKVYFGEELVNTTTIDIEDIDDINLDDLKLSYTFNKVGKYLITCTVQNCNTFVTKQFEINVCGPIKYRKISCEKTRIYNPTINSVNFFLKDLEDNVISSGVIPSLAFVEINIPEGIFKIQASNLTNFIINWCSIENCYIDIVKGYLCEKCGCSDKTKEDFEMRFTSVYNIYKKLIDTSEIYEISYSNLDIEEKIEKMYSANELAKYLLSLCDCYKKDKKNCGC